MCGLVGIIGNIGKKEKEAFTEGLFITNFVRGPDSTGVLKVDENGYSWKKSLGFITELIEEEIEKNSDFFSLPDGNVSGNPFIILGHGRKATQGAVNAELAHPFEYEGVVSAHNGTISSYHFDDKSDALIDSQKLLKEVSENWDDIPSVYKKFPDNTTSAQACWSWNKKSPKSFKLWRNGQRTLFFVLSKDKKIAAFASEFGILRKMFKRAKIHNKFDWGKSIEDHRLPKDKLFTFTYNEEDGGTVSYDTEKMDPKAVYYGNHTSSSYKGTTVSNVVKPQTTHRYQENFFDWSSDTNKSYYTGIASGTGPKNFPKALGYWVFSKTLNCWIWTNAETNIGHVSRRKAKLKNPTFCYKFVEKAKRSVPFVYMEELKNFGHPKWTPELEKPDWIKLISLKNSKGEIVFRSCPKDSRDLGLEFTLNAPFYKHLVSQTVMDLETPGCFWLTKKLHRADNKKEVPLESLKTYKDEKEVGSSVVPFRVSKTDSITHNFYGLEDDYYDDDYDYLDDDYYNNHGGDVDVDNFYNYLNTYVSEKDLIRILDSMGSCVLCGKDSSRISRKNLEKVCFVDHDTFICDTCVTSYGENQALNLVALNWT